MKECPSEKEFETLLKELSEEYQEVLERLKNGNGTSPQTESEKTPKGEI
jgi:NTP pyrophosphatase (non-canonical NTP hydrolase)